MTIRRKVGADSFCQSSLELFSVSFNVEESWKLWQRGQFFLLIFFSFCLTSYWQAGMLILEFFFLFQILKKQKQTKKYNFYSHWPQEGYWPIHYKRYHLLDLRVCDRDKTFLQNGSKWINGLFGDTVVKKCDMWICCALCNVKSKKKHLKLSKTPR